MAQATQPSKKLTFSSTPTAPFFVNSMPQQIPLQGYQRQMNINGLMTLPTTKPVDITLSCEKSAKICLVQWQNSCLPYHLATTNTIRIFRNGKQIVAKNLESDASEYSVETIPGECYTCEYIIINSQNNEIAKGSICFRATFSMTEMIQLYQKAHDYCRVIYPGMNQFHFLYRNKPHWYWNDIQNRTDNIMPPYIKDNSGQAANPINGKINGLFFSANVMNYGNLPSTSPFGNKRMTIHAQILLDLERVNIYFCDFYCNNITHYVTIVVCDKGSGTDSYCADKLVPLPLDNPFLQVFNKSGRYDFHVHNKVWIEILYTENVSMNGVNIESVYSSSTSNPEGVPHNKRCTVCNLYPNCY